MPLDPVSGDVMAPERRFDRLPQVDFLDPFPGGRLPAFDPLVDAVADMDTVFV